MKTVIAQIERVIEEILGSNLMIHAIMIVAAVASFGNVKSFFDALHASGFTSAGIATTLGCALVVISSSLAKLDFRRITDDRRVQFVALAATVLALLSGTIQFFEYRKHISTPYAIMLGYGLPVVLEVVMAAVVATLKSIASSRRTEILRASVEERMANALDEAVNLLDTSLVNNEIENAAKLFTQESVNNIFGELFYRLQQSSQHKLTDFVGTNSMSGQVDSGQVNSTQEVSDQVVDDPQFTKDTPLEHGGQTLENATKILGHIERNGFKSLVDLSSETGIPRTTVRRIVSKLVEEKRLHRSEEFGQVSYSLNGFH